MAKKKEMRGPVEFNGTVYHKGQEEQLEEALSSYASGGMTPDEKARRKAQVEHTYENLAKHGAYGEMGEDGEIVQIDNPDSTLRAGALGRFHDPLGERKEAKGAPKGQAEEINLTSATDLTGGTREGAEADDRRDSTVFSEGAGGGAPASSPASSSPAKGSKR